MMDTVDRVSQASDKGIALKKQLRAKLIEHKWYPDKNGQELPEISNWEWSVTHE